MPKTTAYAITTEDRGHGIQAVYVQGLSTQINAIHRAAKAYARKTWGVTGPVSGGGSFTDKGETYTAQEIFCVPRTCGHAHHTYAVRTRSRTLYQGDSATEAARALEERRANRRARAIVAVVASDPTGSCCYRESARVAEL